MQPTKCWRSHSAKFLIKFNKTLVQDRCIFASKFDINAKRKRRIRLLLLHLLLLWFLSNLFIFHSVTLLCFCFIFHRTKVIQAFVCVFLGTRLDINKDTHQNTADYVNNSILAANVLIVAVNIVINVFEMREPTNSNSTKLIGVVK